MGETQNGPPQSVLECTFNRAVKVHSTDDRLSSDSGALLLREADHRLGLTESLAERLIDPRQPDKIRYQQLELLRNRLYALAQGYSAQDDLDRLAHDPALRMAVWDRPGEAVLHERLPSQPTQSRFVDTLAYQRGNREALREALVDWTHRHLRATGGNRAVAWGTVDVDSFPIEVHGQQQGAAYNGHYHQKMYYPQVASFSVAGDYDSTREGHRLGNGFVHATLRPGTVPSQQGSRRFLREVLRKVQPLARTVDLRLDAAFMIGEVLDFLTNEKVRFVGRLKGNPQLDLLAEPHLTRPAGRPPCEGYEYTVELGPYRAAPWQHAQRLVLVVVDRPDPASGQLFLMPRYFFLLVGWKEGEMTADEALAHYRKRGTFEDRLGEFNQAIGPHLSALQFAENEVTLLLALLAYNLVSLLRLELEDAVGGQWDLARFQNQVLKTAGRVAKHSRQLRIYIAQSAEFFWSLLGQRMSQWRLPSRWSPPRGPGPRDWVPPPPHAHQKVVLRC